MITTTNLSGEAGQAPCPGWSVLGIAGHLLVNDLGVLSHQRDKHWS